MGEAGSLVEAMIPVGVRDCDFVDSGMVEWDWVASRGQLRPLGDEGDRGP